MASEGERRLAAIMFTDMVGSTALGQRDETLYLSTVAEQRGLLRPVFSRHRGKEVKTLGDGFLVEFPSALDAVRCAYDIQRATKEFNISQPEERRLRLRIGIHLGDVVESQGDISGDAVNVASRIQPLADEGGVCITRQVYDHVQNKFEIRLVSLGAMPLKGVGAPTEVFKMVMPWAGERETLAAQLDRKRLAVLPFANISPDPNDEYFADGLTEELITKLSEIGELRVIARTSIMNYKRKEKNVSEIARELGVGSVIEGSVRKAGNKVRVTVQLIDAHNEEHLWASNYDRELDDIFAIQSDVASKVAGSLSAGVFAKEAKDTDDLEAYTAYLKGVQLLHDGSETSVREAISLFDHSIARDPAFARAYASLAEAWGVIAAGGYEGYEVVTAKAELAARKALELGPGRAESHSAMAEVHTLLDRAEQAIAEAEKAIEINPNLADAHVALGIQHSATGRLEQGLESFRKAYELDPLSFRAGSYVASILTLTGKESEGMAIMERMRDLNPRNPRAWVSLGVSYMYRREFDKAQDMLDAARRINPDEPMLKTNQGVLYAVTGRKHDAEEVLHDFIDEPKESVRLMGQLLLSSALGDMDGAFKALMRQAETHSWPFLVKSIPVFEPLRKDPRFAEFCRRVGLPP